MKKNMIIITAVFVTGTLIFIILYRVLGFGILLTMSITFGTISYHFVMRLVVGFLYNIFMNNHADYQNSWFNVSTNEQKLYEKLRVKKWKYKMPVFEPDIFDPRKHSWVEIIQATCQAELVHETIVVLSFLPIIAGLWFGVYPVFIITSVGAAIVDTVFIIIQRYNRPRILNLIKR